jgi:integrating conjugative element protein (TIGR03756 family)
MHYKIVGLCFWQKAWYSPPTVTLKLDQYLPDAVVSVYTKPTNNPWFFAKDIEDPAFYQAGKIEFKTMTHNNMGFGDEHDNTQRDYNNRFHEVDIIGNPALIFFSGHDVMLPSSAKPYEPYYSSLFDSYAWRFPALERFYPGSIIPGLHDVGTLILHDWGPIYPRNGYVNQPDDAKAAAVDALRASTIVTADGQPHLYHRLSNNCGNHCHAYAVKENSKDTQYQMIYPNIENQCVVFGGSDITSLHPWEADASTKGKNRYVWILWRHYHGCVPGSGHYIGSIDF